MFSNPDFQAYQESGQWSVKDSRVELTLTPSTLHTNIVFPAVEYHILLVRYVWSGQIGRGQWSVKDSRVELTLTPSTLHTNIVFPAVEYHILLVRYVWSGHIGLPQVGTEATKAHFWNAEFEFPHRISMSPS